MRKICAVTGSRADYGLLLKTMVRLREDPNIDFKLLVCGDHLDKKSPPVNIMADGFLDYGTVHLGGEDPPEMDHVSLVGAMAQGLGGFNRAFFNWRPDIVLLLGDRYEIFCAAQVAMFHNIPIAHIHGGETTAGSMDNAMRHSITKMSHIHFVVNELFADKVARLGEVKENIHVVGSPGLEGIGKYQNKVLNKAVAPIKSTLPMEKMFLIVYHPETLSDVRPNIVMDNIIAAVSKFKNVSMIFIGTNSDLFYQMIEPQILSYVGDNKDRALYFRSVDRNAYLMYLNKCAVIIGNSSSGIIEAPALMTPTVNIGKRQLGRPTAWSVITVYPCKEEIVRGIVAALEKEIDENEICPYYSDNTSEKIVDVLKSVSLDNILYKEF